MGLGGRRCSKLIGNNNTRKGLGDCTSFWFAVPWFFLYWSFSHILFGYYPTWRESFGSVLVYDRFATGIILMLKIRKDKKAIILNTNRNEL